MRPPAMSLVVAQAFGASLLTDVAELRGPAAIGEQGDLVATVRVSVQSLSTTYTPQTKLDRPPVFTEAFLAVMPISAPLAGWEYLVLTRTADPELIGVRMYVRGRPMDSSPAVRAFQVARTKAETGGGVILP